MKDYLESLTLKNWLSYEKAIFHFHPGVNMIIGPSDKGKSAAMAALYKLISNRPLGDKFRSWWGGPVYIGLKIGNKLLRYKKDKKAVYQIKNLDTKKVINLAVPKAGVPEEISTLLRIDRKINIQKQLEKKSPIFLLSENSADVARHLNNVANLGGIDTCLSRAKEDLSADVKKKKAVDAIIKTKVKELSKYKYLDAFNILVNYAEKIEKRIKHDEQLLDKILDLMQEIDKYIKRLKTIHTKLKMRPVIDKTAILFDKISKNQIKLFNLTGNLSQIKRDQRELIRIQNRLKLKPLIRRCVNLNLIIDQYEHDRSKILGTLEGIKVMKKDINSYVVKLGKLKKIYKRDFPVICPFCHQKADKEKL